MKIYVVRHGETEDNVKGLVQGQNDSPLTLKGIKEAEKLKNLIKNKNIDIVISSPLKRAYETAKILVDNSLNINIDSRIIERNWGLCERAKVDEVDHVDCWNYYLNVNNNGIEELWEVIERVSEFVEDLKRRYKDENILVVTHSAISKCIYYCFNDIPEDGNLNNIKVSNLQIMEYDL